MLDQSASADENACRCVVEDKGVEDKGVDDNVVDDKVVEDKAACSMTAQRREIQYLVLANPTEPFLLARVRWPDIYQAISPVRPYWQDDPGLFDLPYASTSTTVTCDEAAQIAIEWGARFPSDEEDQTSGPSLIRRMPSDWSNLSTAERRAWSIEVGRSPATRATVPTSAAADLPAGRVVRTSAPPSRRRRWPRRRVEPVLVAGSAPHVASISNGPPAASPVIDLTEPREAARAIVDHV